jgi:hypothetical protein
MKNYGLYDEIHPVHIGCVCLIFVTTYRDLQVAKNYAEESDPPAPLSFLLAAEQLMQQLSLSFP